MKFSTTETKKPPSFLGSAAVRRSNLRTIFESHDNNMKTPEELNALKEEVKDLNKKLSELSWDELSQVSGGEADNSCPKNLYSQHEPPLHME